MTSQEVSLCTVCESFCWRVFWHCSESCDFVHVAIISNNIFPYFLACSVVVLFIFILHRIPLGWFGVVYTLQLVLCKILFIRSRGGKFVAITNKYAFQKMFNCPSSWSDPLLRCYCCSCAELYPHKTGRLQLYITIPISPRMYSTQATNLEYNSDG